MNNKLIFRVFSVLLLLILGANLGIAQVQNGSNIPEPPPIQTEADAFGVTSAPIDMYIYILAIIAVLFIAFYAKKFRKQPN